MRVEVAEHAGGLVAEGHGVGVIAEEGEVRGEVVGSGGEGHPAADGTVALFELGGVDGPAGHVTLLPGHDRGAPDGAESSEGVGGTGVGGVEFDFGGGGRNAVGVVGAVGELERDAGGAAGHSIFQEFSGVA